MSTIDSIRSVLKQLEHETVSHVNEWAEEHPEDGTGGDVAQRAALMCRRAAADAFANGHGTWKVLAFDRLTAALAETDPEKLQDALQDAAGLLVAWLVDLDGRKGQAMPRPVQELLRRTGGR